jgi:hypothetical protein
VALFALNNAGQAVGSFNDGTGDKPFVGTTASSTLISLPPGYIVGSAVEGSAINDTGQVAGYITNPANLPFLGTISSTALIPLPGSFTPGGATVSDMNSGGLVVGTGENSSFTRQAYVSGMGGAAAVPLLSGWDSSNGYAVNSSGQVVGQAYNFGGTGSQAFVGNTGGVSSLLTPLGWTSTQATDINDAGAVVGWGVNSGVSQAFYTAGGISTPIPLLAGSGVYGILYLNSLGVVVGSGVSGAWIWDAVNGTRKLNDLLPAGSNFGEVDGINDSGQILARGPNGYFLLSPITAPEPTTWALLATGLVGIVCARRRG